jgi:outer membrane receptor protein involved in Fe transport
LRTGVVPDYFPVRINVGEGTQIQLRDESLKNLHVRGGRGGEILFQVDGMPVTHPLYGGRDVLNLNIQEVEQVELLTGAFSAEYGEAQSGVVNITTRRGGSKISGGVEYKMDHLNIIGDSYNTDIGSFYVGGPLPGTGNVYYWLSGNANLTNTRLNNKRTRETLDNSLGFTERQNNDRSINAKLTWDVTPSFSMTGNYNGSFIDWTNFSYPWVYIPDQTARYGRTTHLLGFRINHILSPSTFYNFGLSYMQVDYKALLDPDKQIPDYWHFAYNDSTGQLDSVYSEVGPPRIDPATGFYESGSEVINQKTFTETFTLKFDFRSQLDKNNFIKTGIQLIYNNIDYLDIADGALFLSKYGEWKYRDGEYFDPPPGPYPEFGRTRWVYKAFPLVGGLYIEDKFERGSLIFNAGVRLDFFNKGSSVKDKVWKQKWEDATGLKADWDQWIYTLSPRFGISFPVFESTVLFFSYGHFNQLPELQYYYRDPYSGGLTGNPHLDYIQTILYEFGFTHKLTNDLAIDIKTFQRDISNQVDTQLLLANLGLPVALFDNKGYSRARGIEIELDKVYSNFTSGHIAYTVQWATGFSSSSFQEYILSQSDIPNPIRERRLDWDERHQIIANLTLQSPKGQHMNLFGWQVPDMWAATLLIRFGSGIPYTPGTRDPIEAQLLYNSLDLPWTLGLDIKFQKTFEWNNLFLDLFLDVFNAINRVNSRAINSWTGKPYEYGDVWEDSNQYNTWRTNVGYQNPQAIADPVNLQFGVRFRF